MRKLSLYFTLFLVFMSLAYSAPPFTQIQESSEENLELRIIFPKTYQLKQGEPFKMHFHVFNSSGFQLYPSQLSCYLHIYNFSNAHIKEVNLTPDSNNLEMVFNADSTLSKDVGYYPYLIYCNSSSNQAGYVSAEYLVANTYADIGNNDMTPLAIILVGLLFFLIYFAQQVVIKTEDDQIIPLNGLFVTILYTSAVYMAFMTLQVGVGIALVNTPDNQILSGVLGIFRFINGVIPIVLIILIVGLIISAFYLIAQFLIERYKK